MLATKTIDQKTIRIENRKKIFHILIRRREVTIPEISREVGVSIPTITKNITHLITEGIAEEAGVSESTGGRRPMVIRFLPDAYYSVGVAFLMDAVRIVLTNLDSDIKADRTLRMVDFSEIDLVMQHLQQEVESILLEKEIAPDRVLGMGLSVPGTVNEETRLLQIAPHLKMRNIDFAAYQELFAFALFIENDANAAAMAELTLGIAKAMRNLVYLSVLPQGIGAGIVVGGQLYRGKNKRAGELSHVTIASNGRQCSCGRKDCWELYASANSLLDMYYERTGKRVQALEDFFTALKKFEPAAADVFDTYLDYLALGIQNIILIQDPHYVIIGGVISPYEEFFLEPLREKVFVENNFYDSTDVKIMCSTLKQDASILGVALLPFERVFSLDEIQQLVI